MTGKQRSIIWLLAGALIIPALLYKAYDWYDSRKAALPFLGPASGGAAYRVPGFTLTDQDGHPFSLENHGKKIVLDFFFTRCPTICPVMARNMLGVYRALADDPEVLFISVSIDPEHDTPERLTRYRKRLGADDGRWIFLTGDRDLIYDMARNLFFVSAVPAGKHVEEIIHSDNFILLDGKHRIRGYYRGTDNESVRQLVADLQNPAKWFENP